MSLKVEYPDLGAFLYDYTDNLSRGGTFISSTREWTVGAPVRLSLSFPGLLEPVRLVGVVSWVRLGKEPGVGVEFRFDEDPEQEQRLRRLVAAIERGDPCVVARRFRILVAEDNPLIPKLLEEGLARLARRRPDRPVLELSTAADGATARTMLASEPFDLLVVDFHLPVLDGERLIELCRHQYAPALPIICLGGGDPEEHRRAIAAGADFYLQKPLRLVRVFETVSRLLGLDATT